MACQYKFEPLDTVNPAHIEEFQNQIANSIDRLEKNLNNFLKYLKQESSNNNYIEIDFPILDLNISYKINLYYDKLMISVMNYNDSKILGHLILGGFDCLDTEQIKSLGDLKAHKITRFKI